MTPHLLGFHPNQMQLSYAILIDGGFLKHKIGSAKVPMTADAVRQFVLQLQRSPELSDMRLHRTYYYDAYPSSEVVKKPLNGGVLDFGKSSAYARNRKLFSDLAVQPFMAMRRGEVVQNGWKVSHKLLNSPADTVELTAEHIQPAIGQKGVIS